jgi:5-methylthioadenosine/S-adenosylhomocysteine deaminase
MQVDALSDAASDSAPDLAIEARWVVPVEPDGAILDDHAVVVRAGRIAAILPIDEARARYGSAPRVSLPHHVLIPGLVNAHTHAAMSLMRGLADDKALMVWLRDHIWPIESRHASPEMVHEGTLLAAAEMLRAGVTCANDMYFFPDAAGRAFLQSGMRAALGLIAVEFPTPYASDPDDYLAKGVALHDALREESRLSFCFAPHAPYTVSDRTFTRIGTMAEELDLPIHVHLHETADEIRESVDGHGVRPIERLRALGLLSPRLIAVHAVHLTESEIDSLGRHGCSVAHCPSSNLKLASGFAPVPALLRAGVNVAFGSDGAASNNRLDVLQEARTAALLAKAVAGDPETMPAHTALRCATLAGARALGLEALIGSIEVGKSADLCAVSLQELETRPCYDPVSHLVYAAGREHVTHAWVEGEAVLADRTLTRLDLRELEKTALLWQNRFLN